MLIGNVTGARGHPRGAVRHDALGPAVRRAGGRGPVRRHDDQCARGIRLHARLAPAVVRLRRRGLLAVRQLHFGLQRGESRQPGAAKLPDHARPDVGEYADLPHVRLRRRRRKPRRIRNAGHAVRRVWGCPGRRRGHGPRRTRAAAGLPRRHGRPRRRPRHGRHDGRRFDRASVQPDPVGELRECSEPLQSRRLPGRDHQPVLPAGHRGQHRIRRRRSRRRPGGLEARPTIAASSLAFASRSNGAGLQPGRVPSTPPGCHPGRRD